MAAPSDGGFGGEDQPAVTISTAWNQDSIVPGERVVLGIIANMGPGFHIGADIAQEVVAGDFDPIETVVTVLSASDALNLESVLFPEAHAVTASYIEGEVMCFDGRTVFYLPMTLDESFEGSEVSVEVAVYYQACDDAVCLFPQTDTLRVSLPVANASNPSGQAALFENMPTASAGPDKVAFNAFGLSFSIDTSSSLGLVLLLLTAMLGGFLLNLTPCVLPVIPIKIMSLSNAAGSRGRLFSLGLVMSIGVVAFWVGLGVLIAGVSGFTATNQLFQYPWFTIIIGVIIAIMAVGMCGLFFIQLPQKVYAFNPNRESYPGSFGFGIMTAILSTPCTAPFMGAAAAWAATQNPTTTLATFGAIGLGMALPYLVLAASPGLVKKMPKTGPASELIKQVMGLLMLAAAAYFVGVGLSSLFLEAPDPPSKSYWFAVMFFVGAAGFWLLFKTFQITKRISPRVIFGVLGLLFMVSAVSGAKRLTDDGPIDWVYYTPDRFSGALAGGQVVVLDFTAEWCLNCKSLEHSVLQAGSVIEALGEADVVPMKVDITGNNPEGKAKLKEAGRLTIPLLVIYAPNGKEVFKSDFYTVDQVIGAVHEARGDLGLGTNLAP